MHFHFYGHSCFSITDNNKTLLFDPFISGNPKMLGFDLDSISCDYILLSHGHSDHILDAEQIAKNTGAKIIAAWEIYDWFIKKGFDNAHPMNTGGSWDFGDFKVKCVVAHHSSSLPDGSYGGNPMGFIIWMGDKIIYYAGDTALTLDMQLISSWANIDLAILPIGNNFTMDYKDGIRAAKMVETNKVIAVHFDTFGFIEINHQEVDTAFGIEGIELILPELNSTYQI